MGIRVRQDCKGRVKAAVRRKGFPSNRLLAEAVGLSLDTVQRFLNGGRVHFANFYEICSKLELDWQEIAADDEGGADRVRVFISYRSQDLNLRLVREFYEALQADGHAIFMAGESTRSEDNSLYRIDEELERCDYLLLLLSPQSAVDEMVTELVRRARELRNSRPDHKPVLLPIRVGFSLSAPLNHELRGYLHRVQQWSWQSNADTVTLIQEVRRLLNEGYVPELDEPSAVLPIVPPVNENPEGPTLSVIEPELPLGPVPICSTFYVERPSIEDRCYATILQPGALIRIKTPKKMGKSSLMVRILNQARQEGYQTVALSFLLAGSAVFSNLDKFLHWFCVSVSRSLGLPNLLDDYWDDIFGGNYNSTVYFENYLLREISSPLVLGLDEVDCIFPYPEIANDFFGLLRGWYEKARYGDISSYIWGKLRLVVVHSTEVYIPLNVNQSPFNVGLPIELPEFSPEQIGSLARRHELNWDSAKVEQLMDLVGGHPYLVRRALYHLTQENITLDQFCAIAPTEAEPYSDHLRRYLWDLNQHPELAAALSQVMTTNEPIELSSELAFKLHSMGLVHLQGNRVTPRCNLYPQYFRNHLRVG